MRFNLIKPSKINLLGLVDLWANFTGMKWYYTLLIVTAVYLINFFFLGTIALFGLSSLFPDMISFSLVNILYTEGIAFAIFSSRSYFS